MQRAAAVAAAFLACTVGVGICSAGASAPLGDAIRRLEAAFTRADAGALQAVLSAEHKIFLAVPAVEDKGRFQGAEQVFYLFERFFEAHPTRKFVAELDGEPHGDEAFVKADWRYAVAGGQVRREPLVLLLVKEGERWRVREIRAGKG